MGPFFPSAGAGSLIGVWGQLLLQCPARVRASYLRPVRVGAGSAWPLDFNVNVPITPTVTQGMDIITDPDMPSAAAWVQISPWPWVATQTTHIRWLWWQQGSQVVSGGYYDAKHLLISQ